MAEDSPSLLIVYATREGQTAKVAGRITDRLRTAGASVTLINARDPLREPTGRFDVGAYGGSGS
ncbi:MAG: flavodoxin domain-containing protein [Gammaproteobacteria bacterium]|nr:flavodoxin domain-containing protein [Gammaproteobacteria bacterium]